MVAGKTQSSKEAKDLPQKSASDDGLQSDNSLYLKFPRGYSEVKVGSGFRQITNITPPGET